MTSQLSALTIAICMIVLLPIGLLLKGGCRFSYFSESDSESDNESHSESDSKSDSDANQDIDRTSGDESVSVRPGSQE